MRKKVLDCPKGAKGHATSTGTEAKTTTGKKQPTPPPAAVATSEFIDRSVSTFKESAKAIVDDVKAKASRLGRSIVSSEAGQMTKAYLEDVGQRMAVWRDLSLRAEALIRPLVDRTGTFDFANFEGETFEEFCTFLADQAYLDDKFSFRSPYANLLSDTKYRPLLEFLYQRTNQSHILKTTPQNIEKLLREFTAALIDIDSDTFVNIQMESPGGRGILKDVIVKAGYSRDTKIDLLEAVRRVGEAKQGGDSEARKLDDNLSRFNINRNVSAGEFRAASIAALNLLGDVESSEKLYTESKSEYAIKAQEKSKKPDAGSQLQRKLAEAVVMVSDDILWGGVKIGTHTPRMDAKEVKSAIRSHLLEEAKRLFAEGENVRTEEGLVSYNSNVRAFLESSILRTIDYESYNSSQYSRTIETEERFVSVESDKGKLDTGIIKLLGDTADDYKKSATGLDNYSEMIATAKEMGEPILVVGPIAIQNEEAKLAVANLVNALTETRLKTWFSYKQHPALSRGISQTARIANEGNIAEIRSGNAQIRIISSKLINAKNEDEMKEAISLLRTGLEKNGVIYKGLAAAEMDGIEGSIQLVQTMLEIVAIAALTKGAGIVAVGAEGAGAATAVETTVAATRTGRAIQFMNQSAIRSGKAFVLGAEMTFANNAVELASGQAGATLDMGAWAKDAFATGLSMALTGFLPVGPGTSQSLIKNLWARYTVGGAKAALRFVADTGVETIEEAIDQQTRAALDGKTDMLTLAQLKELAAVCAVGGGGAKVGLVAELIRGEIKGAEKTPATAATPDAPMTPKPTVTNTVAGAVKGWFASGAGLVQGVLPAPKVKSQDLTPSPSPLIENIGYDRDGRLPSLAGTIPGLTAELETAFNNGAFVVELSPGEYVGRFWPDPESEHQPVDPKAGEPLVRAYNEWRAKASFVRLSPQESQKALEKVKKDLAPYGIAFFVRSTSPATQFQFISELLALCPTALLKSGVIKKIHIGREQGGYYPDEAGLFKDGELTLFRSPVNLTRAGLAFMFLHEAGHGVEKTLTSEQRTQLESAWDVIVKSKTGVIIPESPQATAMGGTTERGRSKINIFTEFIAETNAGYALAGGHLRQKIKAIQDPKARAAYETVYAFFKQLHEGREFGTEVKSQEVRASRDRPTPRAELLRPHEDGLVQHELRIFPDVRPAFEGAWRLFERQAPDAASKARALATSIARYGKIVLMGPAFFMMGAVGTSGRSRAGDTVLTSGVQSQDVLSTLISDASPKKHNFIKDAPILAYRITSDRFEDIPETIRTHLGAVDRTKYTPEYLRQNIGSAIALQMNGDAPDFYIIGKDTFESKYRVVGTDDVGTKNKKLIGKLTAVGGMNGIIESADANLVGALKTTEVPMIKMSDIGYSIGAEVTIQSPWGEQTKPAGQDAYLVFDEKKNQHYMVNADAEGNPISYISTTLASTSAPAKTDGLAWNLTADGKYVVQLRYGPDGAPQVSLINSRGTWSQTDPRFIAELTSGLRINVNGQTLTPTIAEGPIPATNLSSGAATEVGISLHGKELARFKKTDGTLSPEVERPLTIYDVRRLANDRSYAATFVPADKAQQSKTAPFVTDLHNHLAGHLSFDSLMTIARRNDLEYPTSLLDRVQIKYPQSGVKNGKIPFRALLDSVEFRDSNGLAILEDAMTIEGSRIRTFLDMEDKYQFRGPITKSAGAFRDMLWEAAKLSAQAGVTYAEQSISNILDPEWLATAERELPLIEKELGIKMRFLVGLWRHSDAEWNHDEILRTKLMARASPYIVGVDFMGHETNSSQDLATQIQASHELKKEFGPEFQVRVHAGENPLHPENVRAASELGATRVGHGLYIEKDGEEIKTNPQTQKISPKALEQLKEAGTVIELNPFSNQALNNLSGGADVLHAQFTQFKVAGVPVVLGTDGTGMYGGDHLEVGRVLERLGFTKADFEYIRESEQKYLVSADKAFARRQQKIAADKTAIPSRDDVGRMMAQEGSQYSEALAKQRATEQAARLSGMHANLGEKGIQPYNPQEFAGMTALDVSGGSQSQFATLAKEGRMEELQAPKIRETFRATLAKLDPTKYFFVTGGTQFGVEAMLHEEVEAFNASLAPGQKGFKIVGVLPEAANQNEVFGPSTAGITHYKIAGKGWADFSRHKLDLVLQHGGVKIAIAGKMFVADEFRAIKNAESQLPGIKVLYMDGPIGAGTDLAKEDPSRAFRSAAELIYRIEGGPVPSEMLATQVSEASPTKHTFIKDAPILAYRITGDRFEDIPEAIRTHLGAVDRTKYTPEYLRQNIGSAIALQMNGDAPDFYIIGKDTFEGKYRVVGTDDVGTKNKKLIGKLTAVDGMKGIIESTDANLVGALKTTEVPMIKMTDIGYSVGAEIVIQSPWGEQTKPAGQDAYLVFDEGNKMYYMVNTDAEGSPISYVPATP